MSDPTEEDWTAAKRIIRYIKLESSLGLTYRSDRNIELIGYSDADWAGDEKTRRSTSGYVFLLGGAAISWSSRKQQTVDLSSTESEHISASLTVQEAIHLKSLLKDLYHEQKEPTTLHMDNQGAIKIASNPVANKRTKHIYKSKMF
jgi:hypothetical protein